jgi:hypothetical protein
MFLEGGTAELSAYGTSPRYFWLTDWGLAMGTTEADAVMKLAAVTGNGEGKPCRQFAAVRPEGAEDPEVWVDGAYSNSETFVHFHDALTVSSFMLVRYGLAFKNSTGTGLGAATGACRYSVARCGRTFGAASFELNTSMLTSDTGQQLVVPIGDFQPAVGLDKVMAGLVIGDNASTYLETMLMIRTAIDRRGPNSWVEVEAAWHNPAAGNSERNTTALTIPAGANLTDNFLVQLGLGLRKKASAAGNPRATIQVVGAGSY